MRRFLKESLKITWSLALILGVTAGGLRLLGLLPGLIQPSPAGVQVFASVEAAQSKLGFEIVIPAYFPSYLQWPPEKITGQSEPTAMSRIYFVSPGMREEALIIQQAVLNGTAQSEIPWVATVQEEMPVDINGATATLTIGNRADGAVVNGVSWEVNGYRFLIVSLYPVNDLLTMARSMH